MARPERIVAALAIGALIFKAGGWYGRVNGDLDTFHEVLQEIRTDIKGILARLPPTPVAGDSPLKLTDFGEKIAQCLAADAWATERAAVVASQVTGLQPFEIDAWCQKYVADDRDERMRQEIARCAYEFGIEHDGVRQVLRVVLRDALLGAAVPEMAQGTSGDLVPATAAAAPLSGGTGRPSGR